MNKSAITDGRNMIIHRIICNLFWNNNLFFEINRIVIDKTVGDFNGVG